MLEILEELSYNTADSVLRPILQPDSAGDGGSQGDPRQTMQRHHITDHWRVVLHC